MNAEPFVIERTYNAPINAVWEAITDKDKMKEWYFNLSAFKPEVGFKFGFTAGHENKQYVHECVVTQVIVGKKLAHTWQYADYEGSSEVTWELFDEGDKTRLKLTHTNLESFPGDKYPEAFNRESFAKGWTYILGTSLEKYLEKEQ